MKNEALRRYLEVYERHGVAGAYSKHYLDVLGTWLEGISPDEVQIEIANLDQALTEMREEGQIPQWMSREAKTGERNLPEAKSLPKLAWYVRFHPSWIAGGFLLGAFLGYWMGRLGIR